MLPMWCAEGRGGRFLPFLRGAVGVLARQRRVKASGTRLPRQAAHYKRTHAHACSPLGGEPLDLRPWLRLVWRGPVYLVVYIEVGFRVIAPLLAALWPRQPSDLP